MRGLPLVLPYFATLLLAACGQESPPASVAPTEPVSEAALTQALADPHALARSHLVWHPSLAVIESPHAVVSLWAAHQTAEDIVPVEIDCAEQAIVLREGLDVLVIPVGRGPACFT